jgi:hypothetical protein
VEAARAAGEMCRVPLLLPRVRGGDGAVLFPLLRKKNRVCFFLVEGVFFSVIFLFRFFLGEEGIREGLFPPIARNRKYLGQGTRGSRHADSLVLDSCQILFESWGIL